MEEIAGPEEVPKQEQSGPEEINREEVHEMPIENDEKPEGITFN